MDLKSKLEQEMEKASWNMLKDFALKGALFTLSPSLSLVEVACAIAEDNVDFIKKIMDKNELRKPVEREIEEWNKEPSKEIFQFLIVQPYVLSQIIQ